jgi:hypothetical protein
MPSANPAITRNLRDAFLYISDGSGTPKKLKVKIDEGDFAFTIDRPTFIIMNRGVIDSRKNGDETPSSLSWTMKFEQWEYDAGEDTGVSPADALQGEGGATDWVSTDGCAPYSVDITFVLKDPCTDGMAEILTFRKFHADQLSFKEGSEFNTLAITGKALLAKPDRSYGAVPTFP